MKVLRILGVDPGSRLTGYGVVDVIGNQLHHVTHGTLRLSNTGGRAVIPLEQRLLLLYQGLTEVIEKFHPKAMAVEKVFFAKNAVSALKLGQARGAVMLTGAIHGLDVFEYAASEVKSSVVGYGQADKDQVAAVLQLLMGKQKFATADASDGLALAVCHAYRVAQTTGAYSDAARALQEEAKKKPASRKRMSMAESVGLSSPGSRRRS